FGRAARDDQGGTEPGTCPRDARMCVRQASLVDRERPAQRRLRFPEPPGHPVQVAEVLQGGADVDVLLAERLAPQGERALQHFTRLVVAAELGQQEAEVAHRVQDARMRLAEGFPVYAERLLLARDGC